MMIHRNEKGIALITTMMLMVLGVGLVATAIHLVTAGARVGGMEQEYTTSLEAAKGGAKFITSMILNELTTPPSLAGAVVPEPDCLSFKMYNPPTNTASPCTPQMPCWIDPQCTDETPAQRMDPTILPDLTLDMNGQTVNVKIVHTKQFTFNAKDAFIYTILARAQRPNSNTYAEISFLYQVVQN